VARRSAASPPPMRIRLRCGQLAVVLSRMSWLAFGARRRATENARLRGCIVMVPHGRREDMSELSSTTPQDLASTRARTLGALILHGLSSSLDCVNGLEPRMQALGVRYRMPALRGHGTRPEDLLGVTWRDWVADAELALKDLLAEVDRAVVIGLSMGGLAALSLAIDHSDRLAGVVVIAPALRLADPSVRLLPVVSRMRKWVDLPMRAYSDAALARLNTNYTRIPTSALQELLAMQRAVERRLADVRTPLLVIGARQDRVVTPAGVSAVHARAGSENKRLVWFERSGHEMLRDVEREDVMNVISAYVAEWQR
jgi:carboxylesterase